MHRLFLLLSLVQLGLASLRLTEARLLPHRMHSVESGLGTSLQSQGDPDRCESPDGKRTISPYDKSVSELEDDQKHSYASTTLYNDNDNEASTVAGYIMRSSSRYPSLFWKKKDNVGLLTSYHEGAKGKGACLYEDWDLPDNVPHVALGSYKCNNAAFDDKYNVFKDGHACGLCLVVYTGRVRQVAIVTNECPDCPGGMDMVQEYWNYLEADGSTEGSLFEWDIEPCSKVFTGGLAIYYGPNSNPYWKRFQVRASTYPVVAMSWALPDSSDWTFMTFEDGFFVMKGLSGNEVEIQLKLVCFNGEIMHIEQYYIPQAAPHSTLVTINFSSDYGSEVGRHRRPRHKNGPAGYSPQSSVGHHAH